MSSAPGCEDSAGFGIAAYLLFTKGTTNKRFNLYTSKTTELIHSDLSGEIFSIVYCYKKSLKFPLRVVHVALFKLVQNRIILILILILIILR